jgi:hypothetical protein
LKKGGGMGELETTYFCKLCGHHHFNGTICSRQIKEYSMKDTDSSQLDIQVDGDHYKKLKIQPAVYSYKNFGPAWHQGEIIKYITRYRDKNGRKDLEKALHLVQMLIELEYEDVYDV